MKVLAAVVADFQTGNVAARSRLGDDLRGEPVVRRTLRRVLACGRFAGVHLLVDPSQEAQARRAAEGLEVAVETHAAGRVPWRGYMAAARKWALDGWRGGLLGATVFDESCHPWVLEALARREQADAVADIHPAAALLDPGLTAAVVDHYAGIAEDARLAFTQAPPGLAPAVYASGLVADMARQVQPLCRTLAYRPAGPQKDMMMQPCHFACDARIAHAWGRCLADTDTGFRRLEAILESAGAVEPDAAGIAEFLRARRYTPTGVLPAEVEIELTTEDPLAESTLRPRGRAVGKRGPMPPAMFGRLIEELASRGDVRVVLGGFGDPLRHPEWPELLRACRAADIFALAVRTPGLDLDRQASAVLHEHAVDVLNVLLDANFPETYRRLHGVDGFEQVTARLEDFFAVQAGLQRPVPLVVPEMIKTHATLDEMEAFYDRWVNRCGSAVIVGPSRYGGRWPDLAVMDMSPPTRQPCARVFDRLMVLADGRVTACDQDFTGEHAIGSIRQDSLAAIWSGPAMTALRRSHLERRFDGLPLCPACSEWHRP